jgi:hypothetical protein
MMAKNYDYPRPMQGRLAKQQLASASFHASRMYDVLDDDDRIPAWVMMKVNTAEDRLRAAADYMRYKANPSLSAYDAATVKRGMSVDYGATDEPIRTLTEGDTRYLCVTYATEQSVAQPMRLAAAAAGPVVVYAASKLPPSPLRTVTQGIGLAMSAWSLWVWNKARKSMTE